MPDVVINSNLNYAEVKPVYREALGRGADGLSVSEPDRFPDQVFSFVTREARDSEETEIPNVIEIYSNDEGDIAVFDPIGRDKQVYRRTENGSYGEHLQDVIRNSQHMEIR